MKQPNGKLTPVRIIEKPVKEVHTEHVTEYITEMVHTEPEIRTVERVIREDVDYEGILRMVNDQVKARMGSLPAGIMGGAGKLDVSDLPGYRQAGPNKNFGTNSEGHLGFYASTVPERIVVVNQESDFPTQDASTITLETNTMYQISNLVVTAKRFIVQERAALTGMGQLIDALQYTGTGTMFTSNDSWEMFSIGVSCPNGTLWDCSATDNDQFLICKNVTVRQCQNIGTFTKTGLFFDSCSFPLVTGQGFVLTGGAGHNGMLCTEMQVIGTSPTFVAFDLDNISTSLMRLDNSTTIGTSVGSVALKGLAGSGNILAGFRGVVQLSTLSGGAMQALDGIDEQDNRWFFSNVIGTEDSRNKADAYLTAQETVSVSTSSTFYEINGGNWISDINDRFSVGSDGVFTYSGEVPIEVRVLGSITMEKVGGGSDELEVRVAVNWTSGSSGVLKSRAITQNATPTTVPVVTSLSLQPGDDVRLIVANNSATNDIVINVGNVTVLGE